VNFDFESTLSAFNGIGFTNHFGILQNKHYTDGIDCDVLTYKIPIHGISFQLVKSVTILINCSINDRNILLFHYNVQDTIGLCNQL